jgi:hypothetical protein
MFASLPAPSAFIFRKYLRFDNGGFCQRDDFNGGWRQDGQVIFPEFQKILKLINENSTRNGTE